ncbi:MAG: aminotransferase class I/II-fold pyridoxal phosphate-dependent enzyme [SAR324 cluster bacterium]|nr:aminotransferase class I/II-fold pyridoxal phosphate-dependent enzyme [SAR324 cluster bacterium]
MSLLEFGESVHEKAQKLAGEAKDANQIAKILCDQDPQGHNYGIGIMLDGAGQAMGSSSVLLEYAAKELDSSREGNYMNSAKWMNELKESVLKWQRIPEQHWDHFILALPSDAGTGTVKTGVELAALMNPNLRQIGVEKLGWPAYKAIARVSRMEVAEFDSDAICAGTDILPIYQAGPMNTTGRVRSESVIRERAKSAEKQNLSVVLDRAYPGFEFARLVETHSYDAILAKSYELQIQPFIDEGVSFSITLSPTKAFVTFALRPCGMLLVFCPDKSRITEVNNLTSMIVRARGSSFENPISRAFVKAMVQDRARLETEHQEALKRLSNAESTWRRLVQGTPIEDLYSENYAGLFRNPSARPDAAVHIYNEHIYPVFAQGRCRQNVTGIPDDEQLAMRHVAVFAEQCSL